jgi:hypothetical protein
LFCFLLCVVLKIYNLKIGPTSTYRSHCLSVQDAMIHSDTINTNSTVPGHIVISVFKTNLWTQLNDKSGLNVQNNVRVEHSYLVLKLMRFNAPILRDEASVNSFECNSITRHIRYKRRNIGNDNATSYGTS